MGHGIDYKFIGDFVEEQIGPYQNGSTYSVFWINVQWVSSDGIFYQRSAWVCDACRLDIMAKRTPLIWEEEFYDDL